MYLIAKLKLIAKNNQTVRNIREQYRAQKKKSAMKSRLNYTGKFINRSKGSDKLCVILAGYKEYLYSSVFGRIEKYIPDNIDVCVVTSGLWSDKIDELCKKNNWSYLSTHQNNVSLVQNVAINLHPNADYIFKLDEDIFISERYFEKMLTAYKHAEQGDYNPGVIAPTIPINGFSHKLILKKYNLEKVYEQKFGKAKYNSELTYSALQNSEAAKFFWGEDGFIPSIDKMNSDFADDEINEIACPIRFSIGAILFKRNLWEDMGYFPVSKVRNMGLDEDALCSFCCINSRPIMISENVVVGHLGFGPQNKEMKKYFEFYKELL